MTTKPFTFLNLAEFFKSQSKGLHGLKEVWYFRLWWLSVMNLLYNARDMGLITDPEDHTCGATKPCVTPITEPVLCSLGVATTESTCCNYQLEHPRAHAPQQQRRHNEKFMKHN